MTGAMGMSTAWPTSPSWNVRRIAIAVALESCASVRAEREGGGVDGRLECGALDEDREEELRRVRCQLRTRRRGRHTVSLMPSVAWGDNWLSMLRIRHIFQDIMPEYCV